MDYFFENPLTRMYGPFFLAFYALVTFLVIYFLRYKSGRLINTGEAIRDLQIPLQPDPFEIAYLKGGEKQVLLLVIYSLINRGYLHVSTNDKKTDVRIGKKEKALPVNALNNQEEIVFSCTTKKGMPITNFLNESFSEKFTASCEPLRKKLEADNLLVDEGAEKKFKTLKSLGVGFILLLSLYKFMAAIQHGHSNVFFLFLFTIIAVILINNVKKVKLVRRINYLKELRTAFNYTADSGFDLQPFYIKQLQLAIYGADVLKNSKQSYLSKYYNDHFINNRTTLWEKPDLDDRNSWIAAPASFNTGSCSSGGCSSSSGCGSSCGGGCGGGCGGCS
jgi:uncharacterized protein (TIGR04222 family)